MTTGNVRLFAPLRWPAFRWLATGQCFSLLGDQMYLVALPWLALQLTGSGTALGAVLTAAALPRAVFIVLGGALADRWNPKALMLMSSAFSATITLLLTLLLVFDTLAVWHVFVAAALLGLVDAVYYPSSATILPRVLARSELVPGNALTGFLTQTIGFVGPGIAGLVVAWNITAAFAVSVGCSALSMLALACVRLPDIAQAHTPSSHTTPNVLAGTLEGWRFVWRHTGLRGMVLLLGALNLALIGPYLVGGGLLAADRFGGASAFGGLLAAFGAGGMLGTVVAGSMPLVRRLGLLALGVAATLGAGTVAVGFAPTLVVAAALTFVMGCAEGLEEVQLIAWFQQITPAPIRGRVMGVVSLAAVGLEPLSYVAAGALGGFGAAMPFVVGGMFTLVVTTMLATRRSVRAIEASQGDQS